jgi:twinkle protein
MGDTGSFLRHEECTCGSSDGRAVYGDPHTNEVHHSYCFSCGNHFWTDDHKAAPDLSAAAGGFIPHAPVDLTERKINKNTCARLGYGIGESKGKPVQVADYCDDSGAVVAQKLRYEGKRFEIRGDAKAMGLWQAHRFRNDSGKYITICEGEIDCLSMDQLFGTGKRPVVSVPNGAQSAKKVVAKHIEMLENYERVIFFFDADTVGRKAAIECAALLTPGKARIANVPKGAKDICEAVQKGLQEEVVNAWWEAKVYRPDGILAVDDLCELITNEVEIPSIPWQYPRLQMTLRGLRQGEIVVLSSGTGMGKSQFCRGLAVHMIREKAKVGYIGLEECVTQTILGLLGQVVGKPLHLDRAGMSPKELAETMKEHFEGLLIVLKHDPSGGIGNLLARIKYMRISEEVDYVILDHLHMLVASGGAEQNERQLIDSIMSNLRALVESCGVGLVLVSHLRKSQGQAHEESGSISLADLRGSGSIAHYADSIVFLEATDREGSPNDRRLRVAKNRYTGQIGKADTLRYDEASGLLNVVEEAFEAVSADNDVPF